LEQGALVGAGARAQVFRMEPKGDMPGIELVAKRTAKTFIGDWLKDACIANAFTRMRAADQHSLPPPVVPLIDVRETDEHLFVLMPYGGMSWDHYAASQPRLLQTDDAHVWADFAVLFYHVVVGIQRMHALGVTHCDIKLENVLVKEVPGSLGQATIIDFDAAQDASSAGVPGGTLDYMSPLRFQERMKCTQEADLWALGVMLVELVLRRHPYEPNLIGVIFPGHWAQVAAAFKDRLLEAISTELAPQIGTVGEAAARNIQSIQSIFGRLFARSRTEAVEAFKSVVEDARAFAEQAARRSNGGKDYDVEPFGVHGLIDMDVAAMAGLEKFRNMVKRIRVGSALWESLGNMSLSQCLAMGSSAWRTTHA